MDELERTKREIILLIKERTLIDDVPIELADVTLEKTYYEGKYNWIDVIYEDLIAIGSDIALRRVQCQMPKILF